MPSIPDLLEHSQQLETRASLIQQGQEPGLSDLKIEQFVSEYQSWLAQALSLLPDDLKEPFRAQYGGSWHSKKIRSFLEAPTKRSILYDASTPSDVFPYWENPYEGTFRGPLLAQRQLLYEAEMRRAGSSSSVPALELLERALRRFPQFVWPLQSRPRDRPAFIIDDEYDLQDLVHSVLRLFFDDVRPEDPAPTHAGASSRLDFVLKPERIVVETKMTRAGLNARKVGEELAIDIERYRSHPACSTLVALVWDPEQRLDNPRGFEADLSGRREELTVRVVVSG